MRRLAGAGTVMLLLAFCGFGIYHSTGMVHTTKKPDSIYYGCFCHSETPSPFVQVIINGPDSLGVGQVGTYTLLVIKDTNIAAGFNVAAFLGDLTTGDSLEQQLLEGELTHTHPKFSNGDTISWVFHYQAPEFSLFDTLYAVGNSVDTSQDPKGDNWNFSDNFVVRVGNPLGVADDLSPIPAHHRLLQNYPNPFNPSTVIRYQLSDDDFVSLRVYDVAGKEVASPVERFETAGRHEVIFSAKGKSASGVDGISLPSGVYFYRLSTKNFVEVKKMVIIR
jgi:hypothetical protein